MSRWRKVRNRLDNKSLYLSLFSNRDKRCFIDIDFLLFFSQICKIKFRETYVKSLNRENKFHDTLKSQIFFLLETPADYSSHNLIMSTLLFTMRKYKPQSQYFVFAVRNSKLEIRQVIIFNFLLNLIFKLSSKMQKFRGSGESRNVCSANVSDIKVYPYFQLLQHS